MKYFLSNPLQAVFVMALFCITSFSVQAQQEIDDKEKALKKSAVEIISMAKKYVTLSTKQLSIASLPSQTGSPVYAVLKKQKTHREKRSHDYSVVLFKEE